MTSDRKFRPKLAGNALNTLLRLGSLAFKLIFTLYIGRYSALPISAPMG